MHTFYALKMHESLIVEDANLFTTVLRVPGGWIYRSYDKFNKIMGMTFVPYIKQET